MLNEMYRDKIVFFGKEIKRGESVCLDFDVAKLHTRNSIKVPVFIERAKEDGPVLLFMGGVHGDEINGIEIVRRILRQKINKPTKGTIVCIPIFNIFGFISLTREFPDGRDLNRVFPGTKNGSLASQFAYRFGKEIVPNIDYLVDFHTGGGDHVNIAQTRCVFEDEKGFELAKAFDAPFIIDSKCISKSIREFVVKKGKTAIIFEGGKSLLYDEAAIQIAVQGSKNVLQHLGMTNKNELPESNPILIKKSKWLRAPYSGMFHVKVKNGTWVTKKTLLGLVTDPFGGFEKKVLAPSDGYIFCINIAPVVNRGDALFHISTEIEHDKIV